MKMDQIEFRIRPHLQGSVPSYLSMDSTAFISTKKD